MSQDTRKDKRAKVVSLNVRYKSATVDEFIENTTLGRFPHAGDVAAMAAFLAGDESRSVSGSLFRVDGGASTQRYPDLPAAFARLAAPPA